MKANFTIAMATFSMLVMLFAMGCKKPVEKTLPKVAMMEDSVVITHNKALLYAKVVESGGSEITKCGFCYGQDGGVSDTIWCVDNSRVFSVTVTELLPATTYSCRAFAVNETGLGYSEAFVFTTLTDPSPIVKTYDLTEITHNSAIAHGAVVNDGGQTVLECGVCYATTEHPTVDDLRVVASTNIGAFDCEIVGLTPENWYYLRAYAICSGGVYYGIEKSFVMEKLPMEVRTLMVTDVTATRVQGVGEVIRDGGYEVTECGFCWDTRHDPTIEGLHIKVGTGLGEFNSYFSGLERGRTHYMRAYAINEKGIAYGEEVEFVPDDSFGPWSGGTLPGLFSVSPDRKVRFSQGNLQYFPDDNIWRFAERQWDFVGGQVVDAQFGTVNIGTVYNNGIKCDNTRIWKYYEGWMDLFGWGTSGWDNGNEYYKPNNYAAFEFDCASYGPVGNFNLTGDHAEADWGIHNTISNGGSRQWYTPTVDELVYLLTERETPSGMRFAKAVVAGINGMIVLPDDWMASTYTLNAVNEHCDFKFNIITGNEWLEVLEPAGAVFLPAAGVRYQLTGIDGIWYENSADAFNRVGRFGNYWTTTQSGVCIAHTLMVTNYEAMGPVFMVGCIHIEEFRCNGCSVRLISEE